MTSPHYLETMNRRTGLLSDRSGATAIEYAFIAMLIALAVFAGITLLGQSTANKYNNVANQAGSVM